MSVGMAGSPRESWRPVAGSSPTDAARRAPGRPSGSAPPSWPRPGGLERPAPDDLAVLDERHEQRAVVAVVDRLVPDADHLGLRDAVGPAPAQRPLATADTDLVRALLRDADELAARALPRDELVDQTRGGGTAAGHQRGADAVGVDRRGRERGDRVLVEIAGHRDPGADGAEPVQLGAHRVGLLEQVAGV